MAAWPFVALLLVLCSHTCLAWSVLSFRAALPKEGHIAVQGGRHDLWYRIHRPMALSSLKGAPLLVLHGGPQVPSDYLFDLAKVEYRSVIFYDQLGCGRSAAPATSDAEYSIDASVRDLKEVTCFACGLWPGGIF
jgi:pimeloyl-ACP methyl ester carboxylesterase